AAAGRGIRGKRPSSRVDCLTPGSKTASSFSVRSLQKRPTVAAAPKKKGAATGSLRPCLSRQGSGLGSGVRFLAHRAVFRIDHATAHIHEAAAVGLADLPATVLVGREARARRDQPADDDVLLQAAQVVLQAP